MSVSIAIVVQAFNRCDTLYSSDDWVDAVTHSNLVFVQSYPQINIIMRPRNGIKTTRWFIEPFWQSWWHYSTWQLQELTVLVLISFTTCYDYVRPSWLICLVLLLFNTLLPCRATNPGYFLQLQRPKAKLQSGCANGWKGHFQNATFLISQPDPLDQTLLLEFNKFPSVERRQIQVTA